MNYKEQLLTTEWKKKREEILNRDDYKCTFCGKKRSEFIGLMKKFGIKNYYELKAEGFEIFNKTDQTEDLSLIKKNFLWSVVFINEMAANTEIKELKFAMKYQESANKFEFGRPQLIAFLEDPPSFDDIIDLNIHHKYYVEDRLAWEYENDALIVLCNKCHQHVHETEEIYRYLENGEKEILEKCWKCSGAGFIPAFSYYRNGICFACGGHGILLDR